MSFDINWSLLQDGIEANQLKDYLNEKFASIDRPNFLGPISVSKFDFGSIPPQISVTNICEPLDEFYYIDDNTSEEYQEEQEDGSFNSNFSSYYNNSDMDDRTIPRKETDAQVEISVNYQGNMTMSITTELIVNQPTPGFMVLPLTLTLTKTSLKGKMLSYPATAIIAYLGNVINICLKEPENRESILQDLSIESAIGDGNKQGNALLTQF
ncbi:Mitochondrial distribution and morphology protein 12 [Boothiomyces macroporosus]|uniref:Mitochondrial distribution and morphology protein 12 n=1 Tax=Boothiomyces macroporosus TaxID=261099 RepID=A0AAD5Y628_9FUNG|nr:Mitochondrial distribution and morphology protein 12 [Boothiomyces macroporosus]